MEETKPVAFVSGAQWKDLTEDDRVVVRTAAERGIEILPAVWDSPDVVWEDFSALVVRSCWDYHVRSAEFSQWLKELDRRRIPVFNSVRTLRWNLDKSYLSDLARAGLPVVPTVVRSAGDSFDLEDLFEQWGASELVVKPAISHSAYRTWRVDRTLTAPFGWGAPEDDPSTLLRGRAREDFLIQPFLREIEAGEASLVYFGGRFSHALLKQPAQGDFRVQEEHGGRIEDWKPSPEMITVAEEVLAVSPDPTLYARVDLVSADAGPLIIELELLDPVLYFGRAPESASMFLDVLMAMLG